MTPFWLRWLREAPDRLDQVIRRVQDETKKIRADDRLTPQAKRDSLRELKLAADKEIAQIVAQAAEVEESAKRHIEMGARQFPSGDATERLLREQQDTRAWQRAQRLLDSGAHPAELIARAGEAGDTDMLRALRTELPAWLEASAVAGAEGGLHRSTAVATAKQSAEALLEELDRAEAPYLPKAQREALEAKYELRAIGEVVRAKQLLAMDIANGNLHTGRWIHAALAEEDAKRGLLPETPTKFTNDAGRARTETDDLAAAMAERSAS